MSKPELRTFNLRADGGQQDFVLAGRVITYGALSAPLGNFRERIASGAFSRALATSPDVRCLFNHSANHVLGRTTAGTLILTDSAEGLDFRCQLDPNNTDHVNLYSSVKRGDISGCSFAFVVDGEDGDEFDTDTDERGLRFNRRTVKRAKIFDCSVVASPAYPDSTSVVARSQALDFEHTLFPPTRTDQQFVENLRKLLDEASIF